MFACPHSTQSVFVHFLRIEVLSFNGCIGRNLGYTSGITECHNTQMFLWSLEVCVRILELGFEFTPCSLVYTLTLLRENSCVCLWFSFAMRIDDKCRALRPRGQVSARWCLIERCYVSKGSQASPTRLSDYNSINVKMSMERWWNDTDRENEVLGEETVPPASWSIRLGFSYYFTLPGLSPGVTAVGAWGCPSTLHLAPRLKNE